MSDLGIGLLLSILPSNSEFAATSDRPTAQLVDANNAAIATLLDALLGFSSSASSPVTLLSTTWHIVAQYTTAFAAVATDAKLKKNTNIANKAACVLSQVSFYLEDTQQAMEYALDCGSLLDVSQAQNSDYVAAVVAKALDDYVAQRVAWENDNKVKVDPRLEKIYEDIFERCMIEKQFIFATTISLDARRLDRIEGCIRSAPKHSANEIISFCRKIALANEPFDVKPANTVISGLPSKKKNVFVSLPKRFRLDLCKLIARVCLENIADKATNYVSLCQILIEIGDTEQIAQILSKLVSSEIKDDLLQAYQIAFDLAASETQAYLKDIRALIVKFVKEEQAHRPGAVVIEDDTEDVNKPLLGAQTTEPSSMEVDQKNVITDPKILKLIDILGGKTTASFNQAFLHHFDNPDLIKLTNIKNELDTSVSMSRSGLLTANSLMFLGTTHVEFLRSNTELLKKIANWPRLEGISTLGMIHRFHEDESMKILASYLPNPNNRGTAVSPPAEGGALFALGVIHANRGHAYPEVVEFLKKIVQTQGDEFVAYGSCMGLGLASMHTCDKVSYTMFKDVLFQTESAIVGEGAAVSMGLTMMGSGDAEVIEDLFRAAKNNKHEKIIRGLSLALALVVAGKQESGLGLIEQLSLEQDPLIRIGAPYSLATSFAGTGSSVAVRKLLHMAVTDVNDEVRRASATAIGFVMFRQPEQCIKLVSLLTDSYNLHSRYGAAMALGISCSGTCNQTALRLLQPLWQKDSSPVVRQGALVASGLIIGQANKKLYPEIEELSKKIDEIVKEEHMDPLVKLGALLSSGIMNAGGQNIVFSLKSYNGRMNMTALAGMILFTQFWNWFPYMGLIGLSAMPTCFIGLNSDLNPVQTTITSNGEPSKFAIRPVTKLPEKATLEKTAASKLSYQKTKAVKDKERREKAKGMDVDGKSLSSSGAFALGSSSGGAALKSSGVFISSSSSLASSSSLVPTVPAEPEKEPTFEVLKNPTRICFTQGQDKALSFDSSRFVPINDGRVTGIVMLRDTAPQNEVIVISMNGNPVVQPSATAVSTSTTSNTEMAEDKPAPLETKKNQ